MPDELKRPNPEGDKKKPQSPEKKLRLTNREPSALEIIIKDIENKDKTGKEDYSTTKRERRLENRNISKERLAKIKEEEEEKHYFLELITRPMKEKLQELTLSAEKIEQDIKETLDSRESYIKSKIDSIKDKTTTSDTKINDYLDKVGESVDTAKKRLESHIDIINSNIEVQDITIKTYSKLEPFNSYQKLSNYKNLLNEVTMIRKRDYKNRSNLYEEYSDVLVKADEAIEGIDKSYLPQATNQGPAIEALGTSMNQSQAQSSNIEKSLSDLKEATEKLGRDFQTSSNFTPDQLQKLQTNISKNEIQIKNIQNNIQHKIDSYNIYTEDLKWMNESADLIEYHNRINSFIQTAKTVRIRNNDRHIKFQASVGRSEFYLLENLLEEQQKLLNGYRGETTEKELGNDTQAKFSKLQNEIADKGALVQQVRNNMYQQGEIGNLTEGDRVWLKKAHKLLKRQKSIDDSIARTKSFAEKRYGQDHPLVQQGLKLHYDSLEILLNDQKSFLSNKPAKFITIEELSDLEAKVESNGEQIQTIQDSIKQQNIDDSAMDIYEYMNNLVWMIKANKVLRSQKIIQRRIDKIVAEYENSELKRQLSLDQERHQLLTDLHQEQHKLLNETEGTISNIGEDKFDKHGIDNNKGILDKEVQTLRNKLTAISELGPLTNQFEQAAKQEAENLLKKYDESIKAKSELGSEDTKQYLDQILRTQGRLDSTFPEIIPSSPGKIKELEDEVELQGKRIEKIKERLEKYLPSFPDEIREALSGQIDQAKELITEQDENTQYLEELSRQYNEDNIEEIDNTMCKALSIFLSDQKDFTRQLVNEHGKEMLQAFKSDLEDLNEKLLGKLIGIDNPNFSGTELEGEIDSYQDTQNVLIQKMERHMQECQKGKPLGEEVWTNCFNEWDICSSKCNHLLSQMNNLLPEKTAENQLGRIIKDGEARAKWPEQHNLAHEIPNPKDDLNREVQDLREKLTTISKYNSLTQWQQDAKQEAEKLLEEYGKSKEAQLELTPLDTMLYLGRTLKAHERLNAAFPELNQTPPGDLSASPETTSTLDEIDALENEVALQGNRIGKIKELLEKHLPLHSGKIDEAYELISKKEATDKYLNDIIPKYNKDNVKEIDDETREFLNSLIIDQKEFIENLKNEHANEMLMAFKSDLQELNEKLLGNLSRIDNPNFSGTELEGEIDHYQDIQNLLIQNMEQHMQECRKGNPLGEEAWTNYLNNWDDYSDKCNNLLLQLNEFLPEETTEKQRTYQWIEEKPTAEGRIEEYLIAEGSIAEYSNEEGWDEMQIQAAINASLEEQRRRENQRPVKIIDVQDIPKSIAAPVKFNEMYFTLEGGPDKKIEQCSILAKKAGIEGSIVKHINTVMNMDEDNSNNSDLSSLDEDNLKDSALPSSDVDNPKDAALPSSVKDNSNNSDLSSSIEVIYKLFDQWIQEKTEEQKNLFMDIDNAGNLCDLGVLHIRIQGQVATTKDYVKVFHKCKKIDEERLRNELIKNNITWDKYTNLCEKANEKYEKSQENIKNAQQDIAELRKIYADFEATNHELEHIWQAIPIYLRFAAIQAPDDIP